MSFDPLANVANILAWSLIAIALAGLLCVAYGIFIERRWYRTAAYRLELLPPGAWGPK